MSPAPAPIDSREADCLLRVGRQRPGRDDPPPRASQAATAVLLAAPLL